MSHPPISCAAAAWQNVADCWMDSTIRRPTRASASSIPQTSPERLAKAVAYREKQDDKPTSNTQLYLAYGSNLSAETFLGRRGIRPLSAINVSVPTLDLSFDLPGLPYWEPCFANVTYRKLPDKPKLPDPTHPPEVPPFDPPQSGRGWHGGLIGVVYEVTQEDYDTIIRTEGGGASYQEIVVPCVPIPPRFSTPEKPPIPELPRPFLAKTLFAPYIPDEGLPDDPRKDKWWYRFVVRPHRPAPDYAQPSPRYMKLLTDGAKEHDLPEEYQRYMSSLQPYVPTTLRQKIGKFLFMAILVLPFLFFAIVPLIVGKDAKMPTWLAMVMAVIFNFVWTVYDNVFKPIFGDGERTVDEGSRRDSIRTAWSCHDEEKATLLVTE
ncbi:hypothetical protein S40288_00337 [Stachybotrys chartarum IBT 40288]|nr:hypothetical protein S40288_00337 [Stachybotrys chartarum IBT 40288]